MYLRSVVLLVWCIFSPNGEKAATLDYLLQKRRDQFFGLSKATYDDNEKEWGELLDKYNFAHCDEFDLMLIDDIKNGFFNDDEIKSGVTKYVREANALRAERAFEAAWATVSARRSTITQKKSLSRFARVAQLHIAYLQPLALNAAVSILKVIGYDNLANQLLNSFLKARAGEDIFDLSRDSFWT